MYKNILNCTISTRSTLTHRARGAESIVSLHFTEKLFLCNIENGSDNELKAAHPPSLNCAVLQGRVSGWAERPLAPFLPDSAKEVTKAITKASGCGASTATAR